MLRLVGRSTRRIVVTTVGTIILLAGLALLLLPGPGMLVVILSLVVLSTEYPWASRALVRIRHHADRAGRRGRHAIRHRLDAFRRGTPSNARKTS